MPNIQIYPPPQAAVPITDPHWARWLMEVVWPVIGAGVDSSGPQGTFAQLQVGTTTIKPIGTPQAGLILNQALLIEFTDTRNDILYGSVIAITGAGSNGQVVARQSNGIAAPSSGISAVWGEALEATAYPNTVCNLVSIEPAVVNFNDASLKPKWGMNPVFKDRFDGATTAFNGLGSNEYNYFAECLVITAQERSGSGEFCGWNCGIDFLDGSLDTSSVPAWSAVVSYQSGMIVSSGGLLYKAIKSSTNQSPAGAPTFWVQHTYSGTTNLAVGIDFSSISTTGMARIASAIRLRNTMLFHWEETGSVGTRMDSATSILRLCETQGNLRFGVDVGTGVITTSQSATALGGGVAATLGTIGGSGPTTAAQAGWEKVILNGTTYWRPLWT